MQSFKQDQDTQAALAKALARTRARAAKVQAKETAEGTTVQETIKRPQSLPQPEHKSVVSSPDPRVEQQPSTEQAELYRHHFGRAPIYLNAEQVTAILADPHTIEAHLQELIQEDKKERDREAARIFIRGRRR